MIPVSERAVLEWNNIEYFVPAKKPVNWEQRKARLDQDKKPLLDLDLDTVVEQCTEKGLPQEHYIKKNNKYYKQILFGANGYVKPKEMVAILGPSGSGKTSLLNALSQRLGLSSGSFIKGQIKINGKVLEKGDYGMVGAFVQ